MPKRIPEDHDYFIDIISGKTRRELRKLIKTTGAIVRLRPKGGKMTVAVPGIEQPHIVHGPNSNGIGRGPGKPGDVLRKADPSGGKGQKAGEEHQEGILVSVDLDDVLRILEGELELPPMKPKPTQTFEDTKTIYNHISRMGPESLRHTRRTILEAVKRMAASNELTDLHYVPGNTVPIKLITPVTADKRYKQYREIQIPSSNAVIMFARDCSGSVDEYRRAIISDMSWWIDVWLRRFYKKVERVYLVHDTEAEEVDEKKFYSYHQGGGTKVSSAFKYMGELLENRFKPEAYNVYIFYFTDGDNALDDNGKVIELIKSKFDPKQINLIGVTQVCPHDTGEEVKEALDAAIKAKTLDGECIRTALIGPKTDPKPTGGMFGFSSPVTELTEEDRNKQILDAIKTLLGKERVYNE